MFGRVAVCSIAALLLVSPRPSGGETNAFASVDAPAVSVVIAAPPDQAPDQISGLISDQIPDQTEDRAHDDAQAAAQVAALDPAEPSVGSPAVAGPAIQTPVLAEPFGVDTVPVASGEVLTKWNGVEADIRAENDILEICRTRPERCPAAARSFLAMVAQGQAHTGRARIGIINRAINLAIRPMSDLAQWGVLDRWRRASVPCGDASCEPASFWPVWAASQTLFRGKVEAGALPARVMGHRHNFLMRFWQNGPKPIARKDQWPRYQ